MSEAFFIIGTERSGSNLLRVIFDAHPEVVVPHPPHLLRYLGDLDHEGLDDIVADTLAMVRGHIHPWDWMPTAAELASEARDDPTVVGVFLALYDLVASHGGATHWGCKSTFVVEFVDEILARRPGARFVWLVRDVRDVALSSKTSVFNPFEPLLTAGLWARQQRVAIDVAQRLGPERVMRLHYEDVLASPELMTARLCDHVGITMHEAMLSFHDRARASRTAGLSKSWENNNKPVMRNNTEKWRKGLTKRELAQVEAVAGEVMQELGYRPEAPGPTPSQRDFLEARARDLVMRVQSELRSLQGDRIHWLRWRRRARVARMKLGLR
ncbi:MAG TPA: sulfotransferase [Myxococcota bacterium]|nr:sulfotransferase [Myxococcota bacterium]